uniref:Uncharacterized protein n=1 Tax=Arundo donax TaxID=35708 RepID=A0A0A8ZD71_ARUDO
MAVEITSNSLKRLNLTSCNFSYLGLVFLPRVLFG